MNGNPFPELKTFPTFTFQNFQTITSSGSPLSAFPLWCLFCLLFQFGSLSSRSFLHKWLCPGTIHSATHAPFERKVPKLRKAHTPFPTGNEAIGDLLESLIAARQVDHFGKNQAQEGRREKSEQPHHGGKFSQFNFLQLVSFSSCPWLPKTWL